MAKFIQTNEHALIAGSEKPSEPGGRVPFNEDSDAHKELERLIEADDESVEHLSIVDIDVKAEKKQEEELSKQLEKAEKLAAEQREEELKETIEQQEKQAKAQEDAPTVPQLAGVDLPPQDVEAQKLAEQSGAGQRATTQEDVAKEDKPRGRKAKG